MCAMSLKWPNLAAFLKILRKMELRSLSLQRQYRNDHD